MNTIPAKTIITRKKDDSWFGTDYNMNIYKGCCHGCIYCDSRSDCYQIDDFDTVRSKEHAIEIIREELRKKAKTGVIGTGSMSDPYNPFEKHYEYTRQALGLLDRNHFGVSIATKSDLIVRDIDILTRIKEHSPVICKITVTSCNDDISQKIEPAVCVSSKRLAAVKKLTDAGIFTGILMMPILPLITDDPHNILEIISFAKESGARFIYPFFGLSLRNGQREYYYQKLDQLFPDQKLKQFYSNTYGLSYQCNSLRAKELWELFTKECDRHGILYKMKDIIHAYKSPYDYEQITFPF
ncbi:MAG: Radical domain protein [Herbinix sp.]|jgi:DNA repair photolyase|nr:Radical domain protein [Herbinix sp.]